MTDKQTKSWECKIVKWSDKSHNKKARFSQTQTKTPQLKSSDFHIRHLTGSQSWKKEEEKVTLKKKKKKLWPLADRKTDRCSKATNDYYSGRDVTLHYADKHQTAPSGKIKTVSSVFSHSKETDRKWQLQLPADACVWMCVCEREGVGVSIQTAAAWLDCKI